MLQRGMQLWSRHPAQRAAGNATGVTAASEGPLLREPPGRTALFSICGWGEALPIWTSVAGQVLDHLHGSQLPTSHQRLI